MLMEDKIKRSENFILKCHYMLVIYSFVSWFAWFNKRPLGTWQQTKETCWMNSEYVFPHSLHTMKTEFCWPSDRMSLPFVFVMHQWKKYAFGWKMWKKECLSTFMDRNYLCLMLVYYRDLPDAFCYCYLP